MAEPRSNLSRREVLETHGSGGGQTPPIRQHPDQAAPPRGEAFPRPFGRYELRALLGRGGMGDVYLAHDPPLDRLVALKVPRPVGGDEAVWRQRFRDEARAAATLHHPNVCPVFEVGEVEGQPYLTMAYIEGESLAARLQRGQRPPIAEAVRLVRTVAAAMAEAHARGIVHRDLKPANVMIDRRGQPVVMDFGLALRATATDDLRLTLSGVAVGTPAYMPPEQAGGDNAAVGPATDVYALGVILYELITGRVPFQGTSFGKLVAQIERDPPPFPSGLNAEVDAALEALVLTALDKVPGHRFANAGAFAEALDAYLRGERSALVDRFGAAAERAAALTGAYTPNRDRPSGEAVAVRRVPPRRRSRLTGGLLGLGLAALLSGFIYVTTDYGDLVVELSDPAAQVEVRVNGQEVVLDPGGRPIRVRAGADQKLTVSGPDFETTSETFDLKRGGVSVARVKLVPKRGVAAAPRPPAQPPAPPPPPKSVPYPAAETLIEVGGWQILLDAPRAKMDLWLAERMKANHSVTWLDACQVGEQPVFIGVAALDDRESGWTAMLDAVPEDFNGHPMPIGKVINVARNRIASLSGYAQGNQTRTVVLWVPGQSRWHVDPDDMEMPDAASLDRLHTQGFVWRLLRPFPIFRGVLRYAVFMEIIPEAARLLQNADAAGLEAFVTAARAGDQRLTSLAAFPKDGALAFAAVAGPNPGHLAWEADTNLTTAGLKVRAEEVAKRGLRPAAVTAYPWDGAVRYCAVWVKDPPRPPAFPEKPTVIELPGWQILADAPAEAAQQWLADRKQAGHSVTWLDTCEVAGRPMFAAVAALDDRQKDWTVMLDVAAESFADGSVFKQIDPENYRPAALSGYSRAGGVRAAVLWRRDRSVAYTFPALSFGEFQDVHAKIDPLDLTIRVLRPYPLPDDATRVAVFAKRALLGEKQRNYGYDLGPAELAAFLQARRAAGERIACLAAYPRHGQVAYAVVGEQNQDKNEWEVSTGLTSPQLAAKARELGKAGYRPGCVTAYPWDGAIRYCAVWVKDPPPK